jgi:predicted nucleic acid-binding protein
MIIIVDTNIVFSAILNVNGLIGDLIFNSSENFIFFAPELLLEEISRYNDKLLKLSKLTQEQLLESEYRILSQIELISEKLISQNSWHKAFEMTKNINEFDTPFVALAIEIDGILWTGDKKLLNGLQKLKWNKAYSSSDLQNLRGY